MLLFRRTFFVWFSTLLAICAFLNLYDRHGSKVHRIGFPCTIAEWVEIAEYRSETDFLPSAIPINVAASVAVLCHHGTRVCVCSRLF
jgi:hypothetical protein